MISSFILGYCTVLLPYAYKALLAEMCRIGDFKGVGHFEAKLYIKGLRFALKSMDY